MTLTEKALDQIREAAARLNDHDIGDMEAMNLTGFLGERAKYLLHDLVNARADAERLAEAVRSAGGLLDYMTTTWGDERIRRVADGLREALAAHDALTATTRED